MATAFKPTVRQETRRPAIKLASLPAAEINRQARAQVIAERGERPANKSVGNWAGYVTVGADVIADQFERMMATGDAARAWDRRVKEVAGEIAAKVGGQ